MFYNSESLRDATDKDLMNRCMAIPQGQIVVFEDIDTQSPIVFKRKHNVHHKETDCDNSGTDPNVIPSPNSNPNTPEYPEAPSGFGNVMKTSKPSEALTFATLLGILDGFTIANNTIFIVTTNHFDELDPALTRAGRMDKKYELEYCTYSQIQGMYNLLVDEQFEGKLDIDIIKKHVNEKVLPPCDVWEVMMSHQETPENIVPALLQLANNLQRKDGVCSE